MNNNKGFSLIELMVVVAIIGVLASVAIPNYKKFKLKARQAEAKASLAALYVAEKAFDTEWDSFSGCVNGIGFAVEGNSIYTTGFNLPGVNMGANWDHSGNCVNAAGVGVATADAAATAAVGNFTAHSEEAGVVFPAIDRWSIDDQKNVSHLLNGIN